ncbi:hypothetical protein BSL78_07209 [Apostichopus japonicus]|uniref:DED domain-containing protein n=1 Tax=Stichopus japonicus TaxID=307972 RepID=A0A2G8L6S2_STIJA|nr:hypothetical protein BSL78_07209 [Apostichopus japonicus]
MPQLRIFLSEKVRVLPAKSYRPFLTTNYWQYSSRKSVATETNTQDSTHSKTLRHDDHTRRAHAYRRLIARISKSLTKENVDDMKFLAKEHIFPTHLLDRISSGKEFISLLEQKRFLAENSLHFLQTLLYYTARHDLYERIFRFRYGVQRGYRKKGVNIEEKCNLQQRHRDILQLPVEVKSFRDQLHPRSRFNNADIPFMQEKLAVLSTRLDESRKRVSAANTLHTNNKYDTTERFVGLKTAVALEEGRNDQTAAVRDQQDKLDGSVGDRKVSNSEITKKNSGQENVPDLKLRKLRKRLNVNLTKHYNHTEPTFVQHKYQPSRHSKNNPFVRKAVGAGRTTVHTDHVEGMTVKSILPC